MSVCAPLLSACCAPERPPNFTPPERITIAHIVDIMLPRYYTSKAVDETCISVCRRTWDGIMDGFARNQVLENDIVKRLGAPEGISNLELFRKVFFYRLFEVHHYARRVFSDRAVACGNFIPGMIGTCLNQLTDFKTFRHALVNLAERHCLRGVKCIEYAVMGDVLFWTLHVILGGDHTLAVEQAWICLYSSMLRVVVPIAVAYEYENGAVHHILKVVDERKHQDKTPTQSSGRIGSSSSSDDALGSMSTSQHAVPAKFQLDSIYLRDKGKVRVYD